MLNAEAQWIGAPCYRQIVVAIDGCRFNDPSDVAVSAHPLSREDVRGRLNLDPHLMFIMRDHPSIHQDEHLLNVRMTCREYALPCFARDATLPVGEDVAQVDIGVDPLVAGDRARGIL